MSKKEILLEEVQRLCDSIGVDFRELSEELLGFIGSEEVVDYYVVQGPLPSFPETLCNIQIIVGKCLCDCDITKQGTLHHMIPLDKIHAVTERYEKLGGEDFLTISFFCGDIFAISLGDSLGNKESLRRFANMVMGRLIKTP